MCVRERERGRERARTSFKGQSEGIKMISVLQEHTNTTKWGLIEVLKRQVHLP